jgi:hypothetical protein
MFNICYLQKRSRKRNKKENTTTPSHASKVSERLGTCLSVGQTCTCGYIHSELICCIWPPLDWIFQARQRRDKLYKTWYTRMGVLIVCCRYIYSAKWIKICACVAWRMVVRNICTSWSWCMHGMAARDLAQWVWWYHAPTMDAWGRGA